MGNQEGFPQLTMLLIRPLPPHLKCTIFSTLPDMSFSLFMSVTGSSLGLTSRKELLFQTLIFIRCYEFSFWLGLPLIPTPEILQLCSLKLTTIISINMCPPVSSTFFLKVSFHLYTHWTQCSLSTVFPYNSLQWFCLLWSTGPEYGVRRCPFCPSLALLGYFPLRLHEKTIFLNLKWSIYLSLLFFIITYLPQVFFLYPLKILVPANGHNLLNNFCPNFFIISVCKSLVLSISWPLSL